LIIFKGGNAFDTGPLTGAQWGWSVVFGILVLPIGAAIRLIPDQWVAGAGRLLATLLKPLKRLACRCRWRAKRNKRRESRRQKQKQVQPVGIDGLAVPEPVHSRPRWGIPPFSSIRQKSSMERQDVALQEMGGASGTSPEHLMATGAIAADKGLDLFAAVEALRQGSLADGVPGLAIHPDTAKDDPILVVPTTPAKPGRVPPSQDPEVMQYMGVRRRGLENVHT